MARASRTEIFDVEIGLFFAAIVDYESYPKFVDGVSETRLIERGVNENTVEYSLNLIKKFTYTLKLKYDEPTTVSWSLISGSFFKSNNGFWKLKDLGDGRTEVTYSIEIDFKIFAPKMVVDKLVSSNLPSMMNSFYEHAKSLRNTSSD